MKLVLILVLMEDTLRGAKSNGYEFITGLNPCSNGRYSQSGSRKKIQLHWNCLNPCSNGRYSQRSMMGI